MKNYSISRICISASSGSAGKTLVALGLGRALQQKGLRVKPFKKGPDYIDSAWLSRACKVPASNLDPFFLPPAELKKFFLESVQQSGCDFALLEGNRGFYDGLDDAGTCSTAALTRLLEFPVILTVNCSKSTRTMAALLKGLVEFESGLNFAGVILNNVGSARHEKALLGAITSAMSLPVLGCLPRLEQNPLPERHMGLATQSGEFGDSADEILDSLASLVTSRCDLDAIIEIARRAPALEDDAEATSPVAIHHSGSKKPVVAYAWDSAFWFYYPENLKALEKCGLEVRPVSLLDYNRTQWEGISSLYLGGGFPEDHARELSESESLETLAHLSKSGLPIYAECGGLILLCKSLQKNGKIWPMSGIFPLEAHWGPKPQGLGYVQAKVTGVNPYFPENMILRGHEFHYSRCQPLVPGLAYQLELQRGTGITKGADGLLFKNTWGAFLHIFAPAVPIWAANFASLAYNHAQTIQSA